MIFPRMATRHLNPDTTGIAACAALLREGGIVGLPTETVYGLAGDATDPKAVARIYAAKGRPSFNPLIAHLPDIAAARRQGLFDANALALAGAFWPGPLTLVVPTSASTTVCELARAGLGSVALRVPASALARAVLEAAARPIAAPSANRSGRISPTSAQHVIDELDGLIDAVLDGGPATVGVESTIVACLSTAPRLLRPGGITQAQIEAVIGRALVIDKGTSGIVAPGMMASHYAPQAMLRLEASHAASDEAFLAFGPVPAAANPAMQLLNLSLAGDLIEAAANLFGHLRQLDATGVRCIAVAPVPSDGLGAAINDRLARAAAPR
jgi:L-threonylcarbamoyladenylate synthase